MFSLFNPGVMFLSLFFNNASGMRDRLGLGNSKLSTATYSWGRATEAGLHYDLGRLYRL